MIKSFCVIHSLKLGLSIFATNIIYPDLCNPPNNFGHPQDEED